MHRGSAPIPNRTVAPPSHSQFPPSRHPPLSALASPPHRSGASRNPILLSILSIPFTPSPGCLYHHPTRPRTPIHPVRSIHTAVPAKTRPPPPSFPPHSLRRATPRPTLRLHSPHRSDKSRSPRPPILSIPSPLNSRAPLPHQRRRGAQFSRLSGKRAARHGYQTIRFQQLPPALHVRLRLLPPRATSSTSSVTRTQ